MKISSKLIGSMVSLLFPLAASFPISGHESDLSYGNNSEAHSAINLKAHYRRNDETPMILNRRGGVDSKTSKAIKSLHESQDKTWGREALLLDNQIKDFIASLRTVFDETRFHYQLFIQNLTSYEDKAIELQSACNNLESCPEKLWKSLGFAIHMLNTMCEFHTNWFDSPNAENINAFQIKSLRVRVFSLFNSEGVPNTSIENFGIKVKALCKEYVFWVNAYNSGSFDLFKKGKFHISDDLSKILHVLRSLQTKVHGL